MEDRFGRCVDTAEEFPLQTVAVDLLQGCPVIVRATGKEIGEIEDVMVDLSTGRVSHAVISSGDQAGGNATVIAWQDLRFDPAATCFFVESVET